MQFSIVKNTSLDNIVLRLDAEYYHPDYLSLEKKIERYPSINIRKAGGVLDCSAFYPSIVPYYNFEGVGVPFLRVNEIQNGLLHITDGTAFLPQSILDENKSTIAVCYPGDLIIAKGGNSLAKVALLTNEYEKYSVCRDVIVLRNSNLSGLNKYYLWMFLHSPIGRKLLLRTASQTGQPHLTLEAISRLEIPLLSDDFQNHYEKLYEQSQKLNNESSKAYKTAQMKLLSKIGLDKWEPKHKLTFVSNFSSVKQADRIDAEYYQPIYDELIKAVKSKSEYTKTVEEMQTYNARGLQPDYSDDGALDVITSKHILEDGLDFDGFEKTDSMNWDEQKKARVKKGDILTYTTGANIGRTAHYPIGKKALASNHVNILRIKGEDSEYVAFVMNSVVGRLQTERFSAGSAQAELYPKDIESFIIPFVSKKVQNIINEKVRESHSLLEKSKHLLDYAKQAIVVAIEKNEKAGLKKLSQNISKET